MSEEKSKLQLIGEIAEANNKNLELIEEIERLNNIINYIWQVFENGSFEDGCDCIKIYDYLKELKENNKDV